MPDNNIVRHEDEFEDDAFVVGEIDLGEEYRPTIAKEESANMTTVIEQPVVEVASVDPSEVEGKYLLKLSKKYSQILNLIKNTNDGVVVQDNGNFYSIYAPYLALQRKDVERILGPISAGSWRMMIMNRSIPDNVDSTVVTTNDAFIMGETEEEVPEPQTTSQINVRVSSTVKEKMDDTRKLLGDMTQTQFLEEAILEYVQKVNSEIV